jgi:hypothetical protein
MLLEDQRNIHEELERLEDAIADRLLEDPPHVSSPELTCLALPYPALACPCCRIVDKVGS